MADKRRIKDMNMEDIKTIKVKIKSSSTIMYVKQKCVCKIICNMSEGQICCLSNCTSFTHHKSTFNTDRSPVKETLRKSCDLKTLTLADELWGSWQDNKRRGSNIWADSGCTSQWP